MEAEATLRRAVESYRQSLPENWERYRCESMLGATLVAQRRFADAEPLVLSGYEGIQQRIKAVPVASRYSVQEAQEAILQLYEGWEKPQQAAEWRKKLTH